MALANKAAEQAIKWWLKSGLDRFYVELAVQVINRAAQGMSDDEILRYLDYRKRGLAPDSEETAIVEDVKRTLVTEGARLYVDVLDVRRIEANAAIERAERLARRAQEHREADKWACESWDVWRDEQAYKRRLVLEGARGGGRSGKRRKRPQKAKFRRFYFFDAKPRKQK